MAYTKSRADWVDGEAGGTRIDAANLDTIEEGIYQAHVTADKAVGGVQTVNAQTAAYTLVAGDVGKLVTMTLSTAGDLTVPANVVTVPAGTVVRVDVLDLGTARVTFVQGSGMTLTGAPTLVSSARYAGFSVIFTSATTATVVGALAAA